jgi:exopolysaccharide/PEP-CTERM locus tyrosine autokinase
MSLVERALKKLQESRGNAPASTSAAADRAAPKPPASTPAPPTAPRGERPMTPVETTRVITIDREALRRMELLPPASYERQIASQYQHIKRPLVASVLGRDAALGSMPHVVMMASALSGEGKTFTSINLALSLALEKDVEVLLVDADVRKPHVSRIFGMEKEKGLMDLLTDNSLQANQVILRTDVPNLSVMSAGQHIETATELLASERMHDIVAQLAAPDGRRIVLFDSPPLLMSTESTALSASAGQVVLVVRAEVTAQQAVKDAIATIAANKPISLILNQTSTPPSSGYYGYGSYGDASPPKDGA